MKLTTSRRAFLHRLGVAGAAAGFADWRKLGALTRASAAEATVAPASVQFSPELEPLVQLIEAAKREECADLLARKLKEGLSYRHLLSAAFLAAIRKRDSAHAVYLIYSAHQTSLELPQADRLLPLFWAIDHFKWQQLASPSPSLPPLAGPLPAAENAAPDFHAAMKRLDTDGAEKAIVALAQHEGSRPAMEVLWHYGCRDCGFIGHHAIALTSCWRVLDVIGWEQAEPVLRFVVRDLGREDQYYRANVTRSEKLWEKLPAGWAMGNAQPEATRELFALMRKGQSVEASELAAQLLANHVGAQALWDAVHVVAAEMLILHPGDVGMGGRALHVNTAANALHYAFRTTASSQTRLLILLQAVAWAADFVRAQLGAENLAESKPADLAAEPAADPPAGSAADVLADVFASLPAHEYRYDYKTRVGVGHHLPKKGDRAELARRVFALITANPAAADRYAQAARHWLCRKATVDAHEYKLPAALFEDYRLVSASWRPRLLAASTHWLHGQQSEDAAPVRQAREALAHLK